MNLFSILVIEFLTLYILSMFIPYYVFIMLFAMVFTALFIDQNPKRGEVGMERIY